ncbi:hypothetical protein STRAU_3350 [Streptomyces aurantiacus JA 4570]|uniref:Uncharacterized protein n=1 Tax=Streptomyces aurantiacus JA 4570 TaxID=1286094 RepID=S3ZIT4_9ACTN|nr:hypothetical protein STRAU_3350 [Streptomyces aurantiacus JA 4570]
MGQEADTERPRAPAQFCRPEATPPYELCPNLPLWQGTWRLSAAHEPSRRWAILLYRRG